MLVYLDHNATTPILPEVKEEILKHLDKGYNPSSIHKVGRLGRKILEASRRSILKNLDAEGAQLVFTSTGTEANNMALKCLTETGGLIVSSIEHSSVLNPAKELNAKIIPVDSTGIIVLDELERILKNSPERMLVSVMLANNETGAIQPINSVVELVHKYNGYIHCDASQALGKIELSFNKLGADMITITGHKCGAGTGASALIFKTGLQLNHLVNGGGQENYLRSGTENISAIAGFAKAIDVAKPLSNELQKKLEFGIKSISPKSIIAAENSPRLPNTTCVITPEYSGESQLIDLDLAGICVSTGSACSSGRTVASHVLLAMGFDNELAKSAIRISTSSSTNAIEIEKFLDVWGNYINRANNRKAA